MSERPSLSRLRPPPQSLSPPPPPAGSSPGTGSRVLWEEPRTHTPWQGTCGRGRSRRAGAARGPADSACPPAPASAPHPATRSSALAGRKESTRSTTSARLLSTKALRGSAEEPRSPPPPPPSSSIPPHRPREQDRGSEGLGDCRSARPARTAQARARRTSGTGLPAQIHPEARRPPAAIAEPRPPALLRPGGAAGWQSRVPEGRPRGSFLVFSPNACY